MRTKTRRILMVIVILLLIVAIGVFRKDEIIMLFNQQLDSQTKQLMKKKLTPDQIKEVAFNKEDLTDFKEQLASADFEYGNRDYYDYFKEITDLSNDEIVRKANEYKKEKVSLAKIKEFNTTAKNLKYFKYVLEKGAYDVKDSILIIDPSNNLTIANQKRYVFDYVPANLVAVKGIPIEDKKAKYLLNNNTSESLVKMCEEIKKSNKGDCGGMVLGSAYRSYADQKALYKRKDKSSSKIVDALERAGCSEHQLGNSIDIMAKGSKQSNYASSKQFAWIKENASKYGFIIRYPEGKESVTLTKFEPWHLRYVGVDTASKIAEQGLTLDEYYDQVYQ